MIYTPTIATNSPAVTCIAAGVLTYDQFMASLGMYCYKVLGLYLEATTMQQIAQVMQYENYDATGNGFGFSLVPQVDPLQIQPARLQNAHGLILDGLSQLNFTLLANETLILIIEAEEVSVSDPLTEPTLFDEIGYALGERFE